MREESRGARTTITSPRIPASKAMQQSANSPVEAQRQVGSAPKKLRILAAKDEQTMGQEHLDPAVAPVA